MWKWIVDTFVGLKAADWAAWVQAVGTIAAVAYSARLWRKTNDAELARSAAAAGVFSSSLFTTLEALREACQTQQEARIKRFSNEIIEIAHFGRKVTFDRLPREAMDDFFELRAVATRAANAAAGRLNTPLFGTEYAELEFKNLRDECSFLSSRLASRLNGWRDETSQPVRTLRLGSLEIVVLRWTGKQP